MGRSQAGGHWANEGSSACKAQNNPAFEPAEVWLQRKQRKGIKTCAYTVELFDILLQNAHKYNTFFAFHNALAGEKTPYCITREEKRHHLNIFIGFPEHFFGRKM
jgi:hypothetical protein